VIIAAVAEERDGIATEPPVDIEARAAGFNLHGCFVAESEGEIAGSIHFAELAMAVSRPWRGRGIGNALMETAIGWAREQGLHKLCLSVFPHNESASALYRKFGFLEEGRRVKQYRRVSGELWDSVDMGLPL
jgi:ribosomal protein S18 acetylase RimI-like enzyme